MLRLVSICGVRKQKEDAPDVPIGPHPACCSHVRLPPLPRILTHALPTEGKMFGFIPPYISLMQAMQCQPGHAARLSRRFLPNHPIMFKNVVRWRLIAIDVRVSIPTRPRQIHCTRLLRGPSGQKRMKICRQMYNPYNQLTTYIALCVLHLLIVERAMMQ